MRLNKIRFETKIRLNISWKIEFFGMTKPTLIETPKKKLYKKFWQYRVVVLYKIKSENNTK